jgi:putative polyketide hydroxylase
MTTTDVLVVGAGPAGLATALTALRNGARVLVVERSPGLSTVPRATGISVHTMELFRRWGVDAAIRAGRIDCDPTVTVARTLAAEPDEVVPLAYPPLRDMIRASPALPAMCPQDHVEPVLAAEVRRLGGRIRFDTPLTGLHVTPDGVRAELGTSGRVRARFVVGADGPRSAVRAALGIGWERLGTIGEFEQILFRPDLADRLGRRPSALVFVKHPAAEGVLLPVGSGRWSLVRRRDGDGMSRAAVIRAATGFADLQPEIIGSSAFTMAADVATTYRSGPGFLVGDAAHRMTPFGGVGMNTAIHDGHELGWRLAWAVRGLAGDALLHAYATEREPVGRANAERSLSEERDPDDGLPRDLGGAYRSAVILDDGEPPATGHHRTARPGERAPHVWVGAAGSPRRSILDLFENRLTLLTRGSRRLPGGLPVAVVEVGRDLPDPHGRVRRAYRLGAGSAVLVRPDGVVAWRQDGSRDDRDRALSAAVATALGRAGSPVALRSAM